MTLLDPGIIICSVIGGLCFSLLGFGVEPDWTVLFAAQLILSVTVVPLCIHAAMVGLINLLSDRVRIVVVRSLIGASKVGGVVLLAAMLGYLVSRG
jgi:hypothetical protein